MKKLLSDAHFASWVSAISLDLVSLLQRVTEREWTAANFTFATAVSVMSSSRIEGETLEVDSYVKHKVLHMEYLPNLTERPNDLYAAYEYARDHALNKTHFLHCHALATAHLLPTDKRGALRRGNMLIMEQKTGSITYESAPKHLVDEESDALWKEIAALLRKDLSVEEVFYYAALIHLVFVKIHPFEDGNGRTGRLLEKWFLAEKLSEKAWYIPSDLYYYENLKDYYNNLRRVGLFYEALEYEKAIPFLLMLPQSLVSD